jgi:hypothetical protein
MLTSLTVSELARHCQAEARRYQQTRESDEIYCFELFRRAVTQQDGIAWQAIYSQYTVLVATWVHRYSRFPQTGEEADFFINEAFTRLWRSGSNMEAETRPDSLGKYLSLLRLCVWSAIEDHLRKIKRDSLREALPLEDFDRPVSGVEAQVERTLSAEALRELLREVVQDEWEQRVAEESWLYDFAPRQIQARHPQLFATVEEVNQIKHNLIKRLRRKLKKEGRDEI